MHNPMQPDPTYQPFRVTERRRPAEPGERLPLYARQR